MAGEYYGPAFGPSGEVAPGAPPRDVVQVAAGGEAARYDPYYATPTWYFDKLGNRFSSSGAAAANNQKIDAARVSREGIEAGGRTSVDALEAGYGDKVRTFTRGIETGEQNINEGRVNNALNLRRSIAAIAGDIRQGMRSTSTLLGNKNAGDSGASDAAAKAYSRLGNKQVGGARNSAALKTGELDTQQGQLDKEKEDNLQSLNTYLNAEINRISEDVWAKLNALNASTGISGAVDMSGRDKIVQNAVARLHALNLMKDQRLAAARPLTAEEIQAEAVKRDAAGAASEPLYPTDGVTYAAEPAGGAPISQLPVVARPRDEDPLLAPVPRPDDQIVV